MPITFYFLDPDTGEKYNLLEKPINTGKFAIGDTVKFRAIIENTDKNRNLTGVVVDTVEHPTNQVGAPNETYDACLLSLNEAGPFSKPLNVGTLGPSEMKLIYINWPILPGMLPGYAIFAVKATGEYQI